MAVPPETGPDETTRLPRLPQQHQRVWVWSHGRWRPGLVLHAARSAVLVVFRSGGRGRLTDTVNFDYVAARDDRDEIDDDP
jgi:hypothetical protein